MTKSILLSRALAPVSAVLCACLLAFAGPASAFTPAVKAGGENTPLHLNSASSASHSSSASGGASIVRTIVGLAIVIAVIWGLAWILRQVKSSREGGRDAQRSSAGLSSVATLTLGSGRSVHLVRAGNDYVLLGSTEHGVAPIHRYTEEQALDAGLLPAAGSIAPEERPERSTASTTRSTRSGSRLATITGQLLTGVSQGGRYSQRALAGEGATADEGGIPGPSEYSARSPIAGGWESRPDPMRMPSPSSGLIERLRELTVRR